MDAKSYHTVAGSYYSRSFENSNPPKGSTAYGNVAVHRSTLSPFEGEGAVDL